MGLPLGKQTHRHANIEGSVEIGWATMLLCFALNSYVVLTLPHWTWTKWIAGLLLGCGGFAPLLLPALIKRFVIPPRTGNAAQRHDWKFWTAIVVSAMIAGTLGFVLSHLMQPEMRETISRMAGQGQLQAAAATESAMSTRTIVMLSVFLASNQMLYLMLTAASIRQPQWKWLVLFLMMLGSAGICFVVSANFFELMRPLMLFLGLIWLVSGLATLATYLRHPQPSA